MFLRKYNNTLLSGSNISSGSVDVLLLDSLLSHAISLHSVFFIKGLEGGKWELYEGGEVWMIMRGIKKKNFSWRQGFFCKCYIVQCVCACARENELMFNA